MVGSGFFRKTFFVSFATLVSRIFGYIRDACFAFYFGTGPSGEAFITSFRFVNLFRSILGEGGFSSAFVPIFATKLKSDKVTAANIAANFQSILALTALVFIILSLIFTENIVAILTPGFLVNSAKFLLTVSISRIIFIYVLFICLSAFYGSMLNSIGSFLPFAATPIILNLCLISSLYFFDSENKVYNAAYGVITSGVLEFAILAYFMYKNGILPKIRFPKIDKETAIILSRTTNSVISTGITQINVWVNMIFASRIPEALSYIYYADRIVQLPLAIIGTSVATVLLPSLSVNKKSDSSTAISLVLFFVIPSCFALFVFPTQIVWILLERGQFNGDSTQKIADLISVMSLALPAYSLIKIYNNIFYANGDTKTPMSISIMTAFVNVFTFYFSVSKFGYIGLGLASLISSWFNLVLLIYKSRYKAIQRLGSIKIELCTYLFCSCLMVFIAKLLICVFHKYENALLVLFSFFLSGAFYVISSIFILNMLRKNGYTKK